MVSRSRRVVGAAGAAGIVLLAGCGGGTPVSPAQLPASLDVRVSAGVPVVGATVTVYAISDATGQVDVSAGAGGVLGSAGPTNSDGRAVVTLSSRGYSGPVQLVTSGPALTYADPTLPPDVSGAPPVVNIPSTFPLTSFVARFSSSAPIVPVTLLTTLADHEALAWAHGRHSAHPGASTLTQALAARDPRFVTHFTADPTAWIPALLRSTVPAALTEVPQGLADVAYAALFDVALNQLAHDTAARAGFGASSSAISAITLLQLLEEDLDADGRLDGRGLGGRVLVTQGTSPVTLDDQLLRKPLAQALDTWIRNTAVNKSGIGQADLINSHVYDALTTDASDLFGGPPAPGVFDPVDRSPPALSFTVTPPQFTNQAALTLSVIATDATGVKGVFAQAGGKLFSGTLVDGVWNVQVDLSPGQNTVTVWGEDTNQPRSNTGLGSTEPYQVTLSMLLDTSPPTALYDATFASYTPEIALVVATNADGTAKVPPATNLSSINKKAIAASGEIYKLASRLSAGGPPDAGEIEAVNLANVPTLRFAVHFDPTFEAPIASATFTAQVSCSGCAYPARTGSLLASPKVDPGFVYFDLPIASEAIPDVTSVPTTATVDVKLTLVDAAGNTASGIAGGTYTLHVLGPSIAVVEDLSYPTSGDPKSTFMFPASASAYASLFDPSGQAFLPDKQVRLVKYVVTNPWSVPVALDASTIAASWSATETWSGEVRQMPGIAYAADGFTFGGIVDWSASCTAVATFPCGGTAADQNAKFPVHLAGSATQYACQPKPAVGATSPWVSPPLDIVAALQATAPLEIHAFIPGGPWDSTPAPTAGGLPVVPAATLTAPGRLHVYVTRPAGVSSSRTVPLAFGSLNPASAIPRFETWHWDHWWNTDPTIGSCTTLVLTNVFDCTLCGGCLPCDVLLPAPSSFRHWWAYRHIRYLASAADSLTGTVALSSRGLLADGVTGVGEETVQVTGLSVARSITH